jgi:hypothetical protein
MRYAIVEDVIYANDDLADRIREIYVRHYRGRMGDEYANYGDGHIPRLDGGRDRSGRKHRPVWPKLAEFFTKHSIEPELMITTGFEAWPGSSPPCPTPQFFMGDLCMKQYTQNVGSFVKRLKIQFESNYESLQTRVVLVRPVLSKRGLTDVDILRNALQDHVAVEGGALFRYCMATRLNIDDVAENYFPAALQEYLLRRPQYDQAWGVTIPEELKRAADAEMMRQSEYRRES